MDIAIVAEANRMGSTVAEADAKEIGWKEKIRLEGLDLNGEDLE